MPKCNSSKTGISVKSPSTVDDYCCEWENGTNSTIASGTPGILIRWNTENMIFRWMYSHTRIDAIINENNMPINKGSSTGDKWTDRLLRQRGHILRRLKKIFYAQEWCGPSRVG